MNYLDYAFELSSLENKFCSDNSKLELVKKLRDLLMNDLDKESFINLIFEVLNEFQIIEEDYSDDEEEYEEGFAAGYRKAIDDAIDEIRYFKE